MTGHNLSSQTRLDWLRLARTPGVGPVIFAKLIECFRSPEAALDALPRLARRGGRHAPQTPPSRAQAEDELADIERFGARLVCSCETGFPVALATLDPPPPVVTLKGPLTPEPQPVCAIVGSRNASAAGLRFTEDLARGLGKHSVLIASGLARGIDGAAHAASLSTGTIAVLAGGLSNVYPPEHAALYQAIAEQGLLVSEASLDYIPQARDFPRRNRLISGLSQGIVVVEAAERSGSLITARYGAEQGREVMAAPGSPLDPRARGANALLRDGATLVQSVDDVLAVLEGVPRPALMELNPPGFETEPDCEYQQTDTLDETVPEIRESLIALLSSTPVSRDELARRLHTPARAVLTALVELELAGRCELRPNGMVCAVHPDPGAEIPTS